MKAREIHEAIAASTRLALVPLKYAYCISEIRAVVDDGRGGWCAEIQRRGVWRESFKSFKSSQITTYAAAVDEFAQREAEQKAGNDRQDNRLRKSRDAADALRAYAPSAAHTAYGQVSVSADDALRLASLFAAKDAKS